MTKRQESIDLLNATHDFPCAFTFKIIGKHHQEFVQEVIDVVSHFDINEDLEHSTRETPGGRHVSITLELTIGDANQVLVTYDRLKALDGVVMLL